MKTMQANPRSENFTISWENIPVPNLLGPGLKCFLGVKGGMPWAQARLKGLNHLSWVVNLAASRAMSVRGFSRLGKIHSKCGWCHSTGLSEPVEKRESDLKAASPPTS